MSFFEKFLYLFLQTLCNIREVFTIFFLVQNNYKLKDFKTTLHIAKYPKETLSIGKKKSLVNNNIFEIMTAKHCSGCYVTKAALLEGSNADYT